MDVIDVDVPMGSGFVPKMNALNMLALMENDALLSMDVMHVSVRMGTGNVIRRFARPSVGMGASGLRMMGVIFASVRKGDGIVANEIAKSRVAKAETFTV